MIKHPIGIGPVPRIPPDVPAPLHHSHPQAVRRKTLSQHQPGKSSAGNQYINPLLHCFENMLPPPARSGIIHSSRTAEKKKRNNRDTESPSQFAREGGTTIP
jgi:hypothetical protein